MKLEFHQHIFETSWISNFIQIRPVRIEFVHADERTDTKQLTVAFGKFANVPKKKGQVRTA